MKKRIFAFFLALVMVVGLMPGAALAVEVNTTTIDTNTTWSEATTLSGNLTVNSGITLYIGAEVTISGNVTISGGGMIKRADSYVTSITKGSTWGWDNETRTILFDVPAGASLTLENITIDGGAQWNLNNAAPDVIYTGWSSNGDYTGTNAETAGKSIGPMIYNEGTLVVGNGAELRNGYNYLQTDAAELGGAICNKGTTNIKSGAVLQYNFSRYGGAIYSENDSTLNIEGGDIKYNSANGAGGVYIGKRVDFDMSGNSSISYNKAIGNWPVGGGLLIYAEATADITGGTVSNNVADHASAAALGGGIYIHTGDPTEGTYTVNISGITVSNNTVSNATKNAGTGGGIAVSANNESENTSTTTVNISNSTISNNTAYNNTTHSSSSNGGGAGIHFAGTTLNVDDCTISGNQVSGTNGSGGGIKAVHAVTITNTEITGNSAALGGGVDLYKANATLENVEISSNTATTNGGGVYTLYDATNYALKLKGKVNITGNTVNSAANNLYLYSQCFTTLPDTLAEGSVVGVTTFDNDKDAVKGDSTYTVQESDLSFFKYDTNGKALYFDATSNTIKSTTAVAITLNANYGDTPETQTVYIPINIDTKVQNPFTRPGYALLGWATSADGAATITNDTFKRTDSTGTPPTYFAIWEVDPNYNPDTPDTPALIDNGRTLSLDAEIIVNQYVGIDIEGYDAEYICANGGLLIWTEPVEEANAVYGTENILKEGLIANGTYNGKPEYGQQSHGIAAKEYADEFYLRIYLKLEDGSYIYMPLKEYSVQFFCETKLSMADTPKVEKDAYAAMLAYGAKVQLMLNYHKEDLADANLSNYGY